jgi:hypothetical protein
MRSYTCRTVGTQMMNLILGARIHQAITLLLSFPQSEEVVSLLHIGFTIAKLANRMQNAKLEEAMMYVIRDCDGYGLR